METKICRVCKEEKSVELFPLDKRNGLRQLSCRKCHTIVTNKNQKDRRIIQNRQLPKIENLLGEIWKDVKGYEGYYQVSNMGRIKIFRVEHEVLMKQTFREDGRLHVTLAKNHIHKKVKVHRIVASTFIPNPENKPQVNHINGNPSDNRVENLEWCTASENIRHSFDVLGRKAVSGMKGKKGSLCPFSKPVCQISLDGFLLNVFDSYTEASIHTGLHLSGIAGCVKGKYKQMGGYIWL